MAPMSGSSSFLNSSRTLCPHAQSRPAASFEDEEQVPRPRLSDGSRGSRSVAASWHRNLSRRQIAPPADCGIRTEGAMNAGRRRAVAATAVAAAGAGAARDLSEEGLRKTLERGREIGAFVQHCDCIVRGEEGGPLSSLTFAVKDLFDVRGYRTGFGNPTWLATHQEAEETAAAVQLLLAAGATLVGKTTMDELAFGLLGDNRHYGAALNPRAALRVTGGSSSGSASAVAAGLVDFAIGSDTAGSIRVPAAHCGLLGIRATHGRVSLEGARPLQPSVDALGWFASDPHIFQLVGDVLLPPSSPRPTTRTAALSSDPVPSSSPSSLPSAASSAPLFSRWLVAADAFDAAEKATGAAIYEALSRRFADVIRLMGQPEEVSLRQWVAEGASEDWGELRDWPKQISTLQLYEAWQCHGEWIGKEEPEFGPGVRDRFPAAKKVFETVGDDLAKAQRFREHLTRRMHELAAPGTILAIPTAPSVAPLKGSSPAEVDRFRQQTLALTVIAGPAGMPQISLPVAEVEGCPVGLGLIAAQGCDEDLLALARDLMLLLAP